MKFSHIYSMYSVKKIMFFVIIACIPGILTKYYFFGTGTLIQVVFSSILALIFEVLILKIRKKNIMVNIFDNSAILTAILLSVSVPPLLPYWEMTIGIFFSIVIAKHLYGGIGKNIFNPAMIGYIVLLISFPIDMNHWNERNFSLSFIEDAKKAAKEIFFKNTIDNIESKISPDVFTSATPLDNFKIKHHFNYHDIQEDYFFNDNKVDIKKSWKFINLSFIFGGFFLVLYRLICWRIPFSFLGTLGLFSSITYFYSKDLFISPLVHFFSGGTMMCAFFIATDPVTTACTNKGKIIFGIIIGVLVWTMRNYSDYPDAIAFSVLFANMIVPLIDNYIQTSGYGHKKL